MTIPEVARELGIAERTVRRWVKAGQLKAIQNIVGRYDITREELDRFIKERQEQQQQQPM